MNKVFALLVAMVMVSAVSNPVAFASGKTTTGGSTAVCTFLNTFKASAGYAPSTNSNVGAIWVEYKLNSCPSPSGQGIQITLTVTDQNTGQQYVVNPMLASDKIDFDMLKLATPYHVSFVVSDYGTGQVIDSRSQDLTTPKVNGTL